MITTLNLILIKNSNVDKEFNPLSQEDPDCNLYVGKTEYSLTIVDSKTTTQTWNVTYVSYAAPDLADINYGTFISYSQRLSQSNIKIV